VGEERRTFHWGADQPTGQRLTVAQAADQLGVSVDAVRSRIKRGTIAHEREGGRVYILLDTDQSSPGRGQPTDRPGATNTLISQMQAEIDYLREESRRKDHIIAGLVERIPPQIEASPDQPGAPTEAAREPERVGDREGSREAQEPSERPQERRSLWSRLFGG
jgi:excisionase family DNA binding protein